MNDQITITGDIQYHPRFAPTGAKKGYVAKITGRAAGAVKYEREFLGTSVELFEGDEGLYERQRGDKKGGYTRWYYVILSHPEHGVMKSRDCEGDEPKIAKLLDDGYTIDQIVEPTNLRASERTEGLTIFDVHIRSATEIKKLGADHDPVTAAVNACREALDGLTGDQRRQVLDKI